MNEETTGHVSALAPRPTSDKAEERKEGEKPTYEKVPYRNKLFRDNLTRGDSGTAVGTQLALETLFKDEINLFDPNRKFETVDITNYSYHVWNIYTIVRNLLNAIDYKNKFDIVKDPEFMLLLAEEVNNIAGFYFLGDCQPLLFFPNYDKLYKAFNIGKKEGFTKVYEEHMMVHDLLNKYKKSGKLKVLNDGKGYRLPSLKGRILITTNLPLDLCNSGNIDLLESHTGLLKTKDTWGTKYYPVGESKLINVPMQERLLYVLGDRTIVKPYRMPLRREILDIANKCKWTGRTTVEKVGNDIGRFGSAGLKDAYRTKTTYYPV